MVSINKINHTKQNMNITDHLTNICPNKCTIINCRSDTEIAYILKILENKKCTPALGGAVVKTKLFEPVYAFSHKGCPYGKIFFDDLVLAFRDEEEGDMYTCPCESEYVLFRIRDCINHRTEEHNIMHMSNTFNAVLFGDLTFLDGYESNGMIRKHNLPLEPLSQYQTKKLESNIMKREFKVFDDIRANNPREHIF